MADITENDIVGLIALAIVNNKEAFVRAMNNAGYSASTNDSSDELFSKGQKVFADKGAQGIIHILLQVPLDKSKLSTAQQNALIKKFGLTPNVSSKCDWTHPLECITDVTNTVGDLLGGHSTSVHGAPVSQQQSTPVLPAWMVLLIAVLGIGGIVWLFQKGVKNAVGISIGIGVIIIGVMLYGAFAKSTTITSSGGQTVTTSQGGIGSALASLFAFL